MSHGFMNDQQRRTFSRLADVLIPAAEGMPSATEAEVPSEWAEEVLNLRQDLREGFFRALRVTQDIEDPHRALVVLQQKDLEAFNALGIVAAGGYLLNPAIRAKIGYPGQESRSSYNPDETPDYIIEGYLEPVFKRGAIYRL